MRMHPRKEAGIVVDFVNKGATHSERVITLHSLLDADFYREGARVTPAPRRRVQRRARRRLTPAPWLVPVTPDVRRRLAVIAREWQRIDPKYLDDEEQRYWATIAGRAVRFEERADLVQKFTDGRAGKEALEQFLFTCAAENPNRRLRMMALADRVSMTRRPRELRRSRHARSSAGAAVGEGPAGRRPACCCRRSRRTSRTRRTRSSRAGRGGSRGRRARRRIAPRAPSSPRRSACSARSPTPAVIVTRRTPRGSSPPRGSSRCASPRPCSPRPRGTRLVRRSCSTPPARSWERCRTWPAALAENLPEPKPPRRSRRRRRRKKRGAAAAQPVAAEASVEATPPERRRYPKRSTARNLDASFPG